MTDPMLLALYSHHEAEARRLSDERTKENNKVVGGASAYTVAHRRFHVEAARWLEQQVVALEPKDGERA